LRLSPSIRNVKPSPQGKVQKLSPKKAQRPATSSTCSKEEELWLDAIESGNLEELDDDDELKQIKNPKFMTARQKSLLQKKGKGILGLSVDEVERSVDAKETPKPIITVEMIKLRAEKSERRRLLAKEKKEKDQVGYF
jgi:hypothetical protein